MTKIEIMLDDPTSAFVADRVKERNHSEPAD